MQSVDTAKLKEQLGQGTLLSRSINGFNKTAEEIFANIGLSYTPMPIISGVAAGDEKEAGEISAKEQKALQQVEEKLQKTPDNLTKEESKKLSEIKSIIDEKYGELTSQARSDLTIKAYNLSKMLEKAPELVLEGTHYAMALPMLPPPISIVGNQEITSDVPLIAAPSALDKAIDLVTDYYYSDDPTRLLIIAKKLGIIDIGIESLLEKRKHSVNYEGNQKLSDFKDSTISPMFDPDQEPEDKRKVNCTKSESPVWKELKNYRDGIKNNGETGSKARFYEWDYLHNEIEVYGPGGREHLGAMDPRTGEMIKQAKPGRNIMNKLR